MTSYPNSYGHEKQEEAGLEVHQFYPLVEVYFEKREEARISLGWLLPAPQVLPLRDVHTDLSGELRQDGHAMHGSVSRGEEAMRPTHAEVSSAFVFPVEALPEAMRKKEALNNVPSYRYGFRWPTTLSCEQLPRIRDQATTGQICAAPPDTPESTGQVSKVRLRQNNKHYSLQPPKHLDYMPGRVEAVEEDCQCRCVRPFEQVRREEGRFKTLQVGSHKSYIGNVSGCAYPCHLPSHTPASQSSISLWLAIW